MIFGLLLTSSACEKDGPEKEPADIPSDIRLTCNWRDGSSVDSIFTDYITEIKQIGDGAFIMRATGIRKVFTGYLGACNLPEEAKLDGLAIKVSGYLVTYPDINKEDIAANPFEITTYQILK